MDEMADLQKALDVMNAAERLAGITLERASDKVFRLITDKGRIYRRMAALQDQTEGERTDG